MKKNEELDLTFYNMVVNNRQESKDAEMRAERVRNNSNFKTPKKVKIDSVKAIKAGFVVLTGAFLTTLLCFHSIAAIRANKYVNQTYGKPDIVEFDRNDYRNDIYIIGTERVSKGKLVSDKIHEIYDGWLESIGIDTSYGIEQDGRDSYVP